MTHNRFHLFDPNPARRSATVRPMDATVVSSLPRPSLSTSATSCIPDAAKGGRTVVIDQPARPADQDRPEVVSRGRGVAADVRRHHVAGERMRPMIMGEVFLGVAK